MSKTKTKAEIDKIKAESIKKQGKIVKK